MKKEEIQNLLTRFGFSVTVNRTLNGTTRTHMMHALSASRRIVDYYIDEAVDSISSVFAFDEDSMKRFDDTQSLELWLQG